MPSTKGAEDGESQAEGQPGLQSKKKNPVTETETVCTEPAWVCAKSSANMLWLLVWCFCRPLKNGSEVPQTLLLADGTLFFYELPLSSPDVRVCA